VRNPGTLDFLRVRISTAGCNGGKSEMSAAYRASRTGPRCPLSYGIRLMKSLGVPEGPIEGRDACLRKIDNFLPGRLRFAIVFQKAYRPPRASYGPRRPERKWPHRPPISFAPRTARSDPKWRRKPLNLLKTKSQMAPAGVPSRARRIDHASSASLARRVIWFGRRDAGSTTMQLFSGRC
jgi:hypothetical protein